MATGVQPRSARLVRIECVEGPSPPLLAVSSFLYDLELVHDLGVLLAEPWYAEFNFSEHFWRRNGRPLITGERLRARTLSLSRA